MGLSRQEKTLVSSQREEEHQEFKKEQNVVVKRTEKDQKWGPEFEFPPHSHPTTHND